MDNRNTRLLREYVRQSLSLKQQKLNEDSYGAGEMGYYNAASGYHDERFYSGGEDPGPLLKAFVEPFTDVFKTAVAGVKSIASDVATSLRVGFETIITTIFPFISADYQKIFERRDERMEKIRSEYSDVFERTDEALKGDAQLLAFMINPAGYLAGKAAMNAPAATKELLSVATGGVSDQALENASKSWEKIQASLLNGEINEKKAAVKQQSVYDQLIAELSGKSGKSESLRRSSKDYLFEADKSGGFDEFLKQALKNPGVVSALSDKIKNNDRMKKLHSELTKVEDEALKDAEQSAVKLTNQVSSFEGIEKIASKNPKAKEAIEQIKKIQDPKQKQEAIKTLTNNVKKAANQTFVTTISARMNMLPKGSEEHKRYQAVLAKITKV